ncbi:DAHP synthase [Alteracholeplasma palmae J233]|uniref:DAHP synthase n=1 Tax=Alteracholeplasma palmae (strain ATCC 49389 / J233) TaxID=1318466 RepID=U4KS78_ALTPJ|nr:3-deoxy-7-phosphoheptulonate synthase [Alteracholeplasma palmae]CCV64796.1 DAHP synthase [Alteracholeplasma palmae J233]
MIVQMSRETTPEQVNKVKQFIENKGLEVKDVSSKDIFVFGIIGDTKTISADSLKAFDGVLEVTKISTPYKKASRNFKKENTIITLKNGLKIGDGNFVTMAGPCSVESEEQLRIIATEVKKSGTRILRGGVFKPRTSPYAFQGLGIEGLKLMRKVADELGMAIVTELMSKEYLDDFVKYTDIIQIGARNMQNFDLLKAVGKTKTPILLKRGASATIEEWLMSAEYIMAGGNDNVIMCERGIRTFEKYTRNTLDISSVLAIKELSHLPVIVDPSHAAGKWSLIEDLTLASLAVGSDGMIVEVHHKPEEALSDGAQSLKPEKYEHMMRKLEVLGTALEKKVL